MKSDVDDDEDVIEEPNIEDEPKIRSIRGKKDRPPKPKKDEKPKKRGRPPGTKNKRNYHDEIQDQLETIAAELMEKDPICGALTMERAPRIAQAADRWLNSSTRMQQIFDKAADKAGPVGLILAAWPLVLVAWIHHVKGQVPYGFENIAQKYDDARANYDAENNPQAQQDGPYVPPDFARFG